MSAFVLELVGILEKLTCAHSRIFSGGVGLRNLEHRLDTCTCCVGHTEAKALEVLFIPLLKPGKAPATHNR